MMYNFNCTIVEATKDLVCAYKPNFAFYEEYGDEGLAALRHTMRYIHEAAPDVPVILDRKAGDIGNTNNGTAEMAFDWLKADAITVSPYLGGEALKPFLERKDKGIFVLVRTSNPGAGELQDIVIDESISLSLYQYVATRVAKEWNRYGNCAVVAGATHPTELSRIRQIIGNLPILAPGIGAQGGDLEATMKAGMDSRGKGLIINSSRDVIFADDPREKALQLHNLMNQYRKGA